MKKRKLALPLSVLVEPEGFGEHDFFAETDNIFPMDDITYLQLLGILDDNGKLVE